MTGHHLKDFLHHSTRRMGLSLVITLLFVLIEAAAGYYANSLALLSDAGHNITDVIALGLSWYALWLGAKPSSPQRTYGYHRAGILAALANSVTLSVISVWIFYEAYQRLVSPPEVSSILLTVVGLAAVVVNLLTALLIHQGSDHDLNLHSAFVHLMGDVLSSIGATLAGVVIFFTGWSWLDALVSILIGGLILWNAWLILKESLDILLESTPRDINVKQMVSDLLRVQGVQGVHDLHIWSINKAMRNLSAHIVTNDITIRDGAQIQNELNKVLLQRYHITHATLQLECEGCQPSTLFCSPADEDHELEGI